MKKQLFAISIVPSITGLLLFIIYFMPILKFLFLPIAFLFLVLWFFLGEYSTKISSNIFEALFFCNVISLIILLDRYLTFHRIFLPLNGALSFIKQLNFYPINIITSSLNNIGLSDISYTIYHDYIAFAIMIIVFLLGYLLGTRRR